MPQPSAPPAAELELWDQPHQCTDSHCSLCSWQRSGQSELAGLALHLSINIHRFPLADIYARDVLFYMQPDQTFTPGYCWNCSGADPLIGYGRLLISAEHNCCIREAYSSIHSHRISSFQPVSISIYIYLYHLSIFISISIYLYLYLYIIYIIYLHL